MQLSAVARGCRQTLLLHTVCVATGFGMKSACKSEYLHPQKQTTKRQLYISNWADWAKSAAVSRSISLKLCLSNQTSLIISAVTITSHFKICFCKKFFRNQVRHRLWQFSLYTLLSQLITADFFSLRPLSFRCFGLDSRDYRLLSDTHEYQHGVKFVLWLSLSLTVPLSATDKYWYLGFISSVHTYIFGCIFKSKARGLVSIMSILLDWNGYLSCKRNQTLFGAWQVRDLNGRFMFYRRDPLWRGRICNLSFQGLSNVSGFGVTVKESVNFVIDTLKLNPSYGF